jgi:hypothetical protein
MLRPKGDALAEGVRLTDDQRLDWLRLIRSDNVGPRGLRAHLHSSRARRWSPKPPT